VTNNGALQAWLRSRTGTSFDFNGDMLSFLSLQGYTVGQYNERLYLYLRDILGYTGNDFVLSDLQQQFAQAYGFENWDAVTSLSENVNFMFADGSNFFFVDGNDFVFIS